MTQEELYQLYVVDGLSFRQVAIKLNVSKPCHKKTPSFAGSFQKNFKSIQ